MSTSSIDRSLSFPRKSFSESILDEVRESETDIRKREKIVEQAKDVYLKSFLKGEEEALTKHEEGLVEAQRYLLDRAFDNVLTLDSVNMALYGLSKKADKFHKLVKAQCKGNKEIIDRAKKNYYDVMKTFVLDEEMGYAKVKSRHQVEYTKACKLVVDESADVETATCGINDISESFNAFLTALELA